MKLDGFLKILECLTIPFFTILNQDSLHMQPGIYIYELTFYCILHLTLVTFLHANLIFFVIFS